MKIVNAIPLTKIPLSRPQILSYFMMSEQALTLQPGGLISVPLNKRKVPAIVISTEDLAGKKMAIRKADFQLKSIDKILIDSPLLFPWQIKLAQWLSKYYWTPLGVVIKTMLPEKILKAKRIIKIKPIKIKKRKQKLILVPEIYHLSGLNHQASSILHSKLTPKKYLEEWQKIREGKAKIIIGTRSAVFAPFNNLRKIIIEEEENSSYKSWEQSPRYDARKVALKLAELTGAKLILKSGIPSVESYYWTKKKKYILNKFPILNSQFPIEIIDMRQELRNGNYSILSKKLQNALKKTLSNKKQAILFINRRGAATFILCQDCGYNAKCPNCDVPLIYHLNTNQLLCHHCNYHSPALTLCPRCRGHRIKYSGAGTQRAAKELKKLLPAAKILCLDYDIAPALEKQIKIFQEFSSRQADILIGTQIMLKFLNGAKAKPDLVGIIGLDTTLNLPDFCSGEQAFKTIIELSPSIIQTYSPENPVLKYAAKGDYKKFYADEIKTRKLLSYPPFSQLIKLIYQNQNPQKARNEAKDLSDKLKRFTISNKRLAISILGPAPTFIPKSRGQYCWQIIIKLKTKNEKIKSDLLKLVPDSWTIDVDPDNLL